MRRVMSAGGFEVRTVSQQVTGLWLWRSVLDMRHAPGRPGALRAWLARRAPHVMLPVSLAGYALGRGDFMKVAARKKAGRGKKGSTSFLKKRSKKLLLAGPGMWSTCNPNE